MNVVKNVPSNRIAGDQVSEELSDDAQSVGLVSMDCVVVLCKHVLKQLSPKPVEFAESLADQPKEFVVSPLLAATFDDHARKLIFTTSGKIDAHKLVTSFLEAT
jgi:hypothetical protein